MQKIWIILILVSLFAFSYYQFGFSSKSIYSGEQGSVLKYDSAEFADAYIEGSYLQWSINGVRGKDLQSNGTFWVKTTELNSGMNIPMNIADPSYYYQQGLIPGYNYPWAWGFGGFTTTIFPSGLPDLRINIKIGYFDAQNNRITDIDKTYVVPIAHRIVRINSVSLPSSLYRNLKFNATLVVENTGSLGYDIIIKPGNFSYIWGSEYYQSLNIKAGEILTIPIQLSGTQTWFYPTLYRVENGNQIVDDRKQVTLFYVGSLPKPPAPPPPRGWAELINIILPWVRDIFK